ncbi:MAG: hypothetical protein QXG65_06270 [Thermoplasmata archaeon]
MPTTTLPSPEGRIVLPACDRFPDDVVSDDLVDALPRSELVRALAEGGVDAARALLRERAAQDPSLARRLERLRERVRRQAQRGLARTAGEYDARQEALGAAEREGEEALARQIEALEAQLRRARAAPREALSIPELGPVVTRALLVPGASWNRPPPRPGPLRRFLAWLGSLLARLFGRRPRAVGGASPGRAVPFAVPQADGRSIAASELGEVLARMTPEQEAELADRIGAEVRSTEEEIRRAAEAKRREAEAQRRRLEEERREALARDEQAVSRAVRDAEDRRLASELRERGWVQPVAGGLEVTYALVERFARLLFEGEAAAAPADIRFALRGGAATGIYEKARLRQPEEVARLDVPGSLLAARLAGSRHLDESTSYIYREATGESVHVVLALDRSGSMAEGGKLSAAKKALLALYVAIRRKYPTATIDVLAFDNTVDAMDLKDLWECRPGAFTNTAEALRVAHRLLAGRSASRRELFLITDGLPEAYTTPDGRVRAGQLDVAMEQALLSARPLSRLTPLRFTMILLRSEHPEYEAAARTIARTIGGELVVTDPARLGIELLVRWARGGSEATERRPLAPAEPAGSAPSGPVPRRNGTAGRRRRADRRMGGGWAPASSP